LDWRQILHTDLGALLRGEKQPSHQELHNTWFVRALRLVPGYGDRGWQRALKRAGPSPLWPGPGQMISWTWRRDLLAVTDLLSAIASVNGDYVGGLTAAAHEQYRLRKQGISRFTRLTTTLVVVISGLIALTSVFRGAYYSYLQMVLSVVLVPIYAAAVVGCLYFVQRLYSGRGRERVLIAMSRDMAAGLMLSESMRRLRNFFPRYYVDMVAAGEKSGQLASCIHQLSERTVNRLRLEHAIRPTIAYLCAVVVIQFSIMSFIMAKVYPVFVEIHSDFHLDEVAYDDYPLVTGMLAAIDAVGGGRDRIREFNPRVYAGVLVLILAIVPIYLRFWRVRQRRTSTHSKRGIGIFLSVPWVRQIVVQSNLAAASSILATLLKAGVTLPDALESLESADLNPAYRRKFRRIRLRVLQGETLGEACTRYSRLPVLPKSFLGLLSLGEHSGMLPDACEQISVYYQRQVEKQTRLLMDTILPIGIMLLGIVTLAFEMLVFGSMIRIVDYLALPV